MHRSLEHLRVAGADVFVRHCFTGVTMQSTASSSLRWLPRSRAGQWSVALAGVSVTCILLLILVVYLLGIVEAADSYTDDPLQAVWGLILWASAVASFVVGLVAITRRHERAILVIAATLLGVLPVVLLISEIALGKF